MRIITMFFSIMILVSCNNNGGSETTKSDSSSNSNTTPPDTSKSVNEQPGQPDTLYTAFGNEPFWAVYIIKDRQILFHPADGADVSVPYTSVHNMDETTQHYSSSEGKNNISVIIKKKDCSDGMSDMTHKYESEVIVNGTKYHGCARE